MDEKTLRENLHRVQSHLQYVVAQNERLLRYINARISVDVADLDPRLHPWDDAYAELVDAVTETEEALYDAGDLPS